MKTWLHAMAHRFAAAVLAVLFIMSLGCPRLTAAGEEIPASDNGEGRLIRVAFPEIPGISEVDRYGRHTGLLMDYLNEIAKYTNWEYEYIPVDSDQLVDEFLEGRFDLMGGAFYSPEFERYFAYPDYSMGNSFAILQCRRSDDRFKSYDLKSLNGMTIGAYGKAAEKIRRLEEFLSINGLNCTIKQYGNEEFAASNEMYDYLENGDVDLLLGNSVENDSRYRVVATFDAQPYYLVTVPGNTEILEGLNMALGNIMESEPDFAGSICSAAPSMSSSRIRSWMSRSWPIYAISRPSGWLRLSAIRSIWPQRTDPPRDFWWTCPNACPATPAWISSWSPRPPMRKRSAWYRRGRRIYWVFIRIQTRMPTPPVW